MFPMFPMVLRGQGEYWEQWLWWRLFLAIYCTFSCTLSLHTRVIPEIKYKKYSTDISQQINGRVLIN
jgi:hypothetical protein